MYKVTVYADLITYYETKTRIIVTIFIFFYVSISIHSE